MRGLNTLENEAQNFRQLANNLNEVMEPHPPERRLSFVKRLVKALTACICGEAALAEIGPAIDEAFDEHINQANPIQQHGFFRQN